MVTFSGTRLGLVLLLSLAPVAAACGDSGGGEGGSGAGTQVSNDPGRDVEGCFDCTETEYCLIVSGETDVNHCAEAPCGIECDCIIEDGAGRLEACADYSCQDGSGILYCFE